MKVYQINGGFNSQFKLSDLMEVWSYFNRHQLRRRVLMTASNMARHVDVIDLSNFWKRTRNLQACMCHLEHDTMNNFRQKHYLPTVTFNFHFILLMESDSSPCFQPDSIKWASYSDSDLILLLLFFFRRKPYKFDFDSFIHLLLSQLDML